MQKEPIKEMLKTLKTLTFKHLILKKYSFSQQVVRLLLYNFFVFFNLVPPFVIAYFGGHLSSFSITMILLVYPLGHYFRNKMENYWHLKDGEKLNEHAQTLNINLNEVHFTRANFLIIREAKLQMMLNKKEINKEQYSYLIEEFSKENSEVLYKMKIPSFSLSILIIVIQRWFSVISSGSIFEPKILDDLSAASSIAFLVMILLPYIEFNLFKLHYDFKARANKEFRRFLVDYGLKHYSDPSK